MIILIFSSSSACHGKPTVHAGPLLSPRLRSSSVVLFLKHHGDPRGGRYNSMMSWHFLKKKKGGKKVENCLRGWLGYLSRNRPDTFSSEPSFKHESVPLRRAIIGRSPPPSGTGEEEEEYAEILIQRMMEKDLVCLLLQEISIWRGYIHSKMLCGASKKKLADGWKKMHTSAGLVLTLTATPLY